MNRVQFYSAIMALEVEHSCSSWAPRCKQCDKKTETHDLLMSFFDSKTTALELANDHRQRLLDKLSAVRALAERLRERSYSMRFEQHASIEDVKTFCAVMDSCAAQIDDALGEIGEKP